jgi:tRNA (cmo5U34)-methyltransferase
MSDWTFEDKEIATDFDAHVREQLPWYDLVTNAVSHITRHYLTQKGLVYDIGCSNGNIGRAISEILQSRNAHLIGIEPSREMAETYRAPGEIRIESAQNIQYENFDVAILFLSLMFLPPLHQIKLINELKLKVKRGGSIIIVDKCLPSTGYLSTVMWRLTLQSKLNNGVSAQDIMTKELSLGGVQRPIDVSILNGAVEFFRYGDFAGWVIEG